jgi:hypothetical protein
MGTSFPLTGPLNRGYRINIVPRAVITFFAPSARLIVVDETGKREATIS